MARFCQKCGAEVPEGSPVCRSCFEPVKPEGFFARLLRRLGIELVSSAKSLPGRGLTIKFSTSESIKIRDPLTGDLREYHSTDEVPEPFRDQIRKLRESAASTESKTVITVTNSSGKLQTYHSVDELPPELRALYGQARKGKS